MKLPIGTILAFGGSTPPTGWKLCNGDLVATLTYGSLYTAIGDTWSGGISPGGGQFKLPDLRNRFLKGVGNTNTIPLLPSEDTAGDPIGLAEFHDSGIKHHVHGRSSTYNDHYDGNGSGGSNVLTAADTGVAGGDETRPKSYGVNWIIKVS